MKLPYCAIPFVSNKHEIGSTVFHSFWKIWPIVCLNDNFCTLYRVFFFPKCLLWPGFLVYLICGIYWVFKEHIRVRGKAVIFHDILKVHFCITYFNLVKIRFTLFRFGIQHLLAMACDVILSCSCMFRRRSIYSILPETSTI